MQILDKVVRITEVTLRTVLVILMALLVIDVVWQVIPRFLTDSPSSFPEELSRFLLIWIGLLGSALAYKERMHLGLDIATKNLTGKNKLFVDLLVHVMVAIFAVFVMIIGGVNLVALTLLLEQVSASMDVLMGYVYLAIPLSGSLILLYAVYFIVEDITAFKVASSPDIPLSR